MLRVAIDGNRWASREFDRLLPSTLQVDGNTDFVRDFAPKYLHPGMLVYDIGSGKHPLLTAARKRTLGITVVGLDIDPDELAAAPHGTYDRAICADVTTFAGTGEADLVICQALLEHVDGVDGAFRAIASSLKPGGVALIFVPSRNALFARLNLALPQGLKQKILFGIYPEAREGHGFVSYYDRCTPRDFQALASSVGLQVTETRCYYYSGYFQFFFPLHVLWRAWVIAYRAVCGQQAAETFCMALRKD